MSPLAVNLGDLHKQMALMRNEHLLQFKAILTPEQFSKLVNSDCMGGGGMMGKHGHMHGDGPGPDEM
jgi:hypothetical protein